MTAFEQMLIDKGYLKFILNPKTMKFEVAKGHVISTMSNLSHSYFHKDDKVLDKIAANKSIMDGDFPQEDRNGVVCFGLMEFEKPPTLIGPRPRIEVKRIVDGVERIQDEFYDDSMNMVLGSVPHEEIFTAMYDKSIVFKYDLTKGDDGV